MSDSQKREMNEALDANLTPDAYQQLLTDMQADNQTAHTYRKLQDVDQVLQDARTRPTPSPNRLAEGIMARIAARQDLPAVQPLKSGRALALGLGITAVVILPLLVALSLAILSAFGTGGALSSLALGVIGGTLALYAGLNGLVAWATQILSSYPIIFAALLLIPIALWGLRHVTPTPSEPKP
jgi:hypothetical protein